MRWMLIWIMPLVQDQELTQYLTPELKVWGSILRSNHPFPRRYLILNQWPQTIVPSLPFHISSANSDYNITWHLCEPPWTRILLLRLITLLWCSATLSYCRGYTVLRLWLCFLWYLCHYWWTHNWKVSGSIPEAYYMFYDFFDPTVWTYKGKGVCL